MDCQHEFRRFSIAMIGIRWQCEKCNLIAPACFAPIPSVVVDVDEDMECPACEAPVGQPCIRELH
jgi:hypothetical protein